MENQSYSITLLVIIVLSIIVGAILAAMSLKIAEFRRELEYFDMEIRRADIDEREHWIRKKKKFKRRFISFLFR